MHAMLGQVLGNDLMMMMNDGCQGLKFMVALACFFRISR